MLNTQLTDTTQKLEILRDTDKILTYLYENEENLTDEMIQIELNRVRDSIKKLAV